MTDYLNSRPTNSLIPIAIPVGPLADAAIAALTGHGGVPRIPDYDPVLFADLRWFEAMTQEAVEEGVEFPSLAVDLVDGVPTVTAIGADGARVTVRPEGLEQFALAILAVTRHAAAMELTHRKTLDTLNVTMSTATPERGD